jgi:hypothetical protein
MINDRLNLAALVAVVAKHALIPALVLAPPTAVVLWHGVRPLLAGDPAPPVEAIVLVGIVLAAAWTWWGVWAIGRLRRDLAPPPHR